MGAPISSTARAADLDGDGRLEIVVGGPRVYALRADGSDLHGWPRRGTNAFASSAAVGDLDGDGRPEVWIGSDDDCLHAIRANGKALRGWPRCTGNDVYSSPVLVDLDGDGRLEVIVGSDDGCLYAWRVDGSPLSGWPIRTGHFVAASPVVGDLDGDGRPEVVAGSWDGRVYAWRADGSLLPGWPVRTGHVVWSSAALADLDGDGRLEVIVAADLVYAWRADGTPLAGWPRSTSSYTVGTALAVDLDGDGRLEVVVGSEALYAWRGDGSLLPGFPAPSPGYLWSSPVAVDLDGDERPEIVVGCWDGGLYAWRPDGEACAGFPLRTRGPIFATPLAVDLDGDGHLELVIGSWDGNLYCWRIGEQPPPGPVPALEPVVAPRLVMPAGEMVSGTGMGEERRLSPPTLEPWPPRAQQITALRCQIHGPPARTAFLRYRREGEASEHPVPLVRSGAGYVGMFQPLRGGERVAYHLETWDDGKLSGRWPANGEASFTVPSAPLTVRRLLRPLAALVRRWRGATADLAVLLGARLAGLGLVIGLLLVSPDWRLAQPFGWPLGVVAMHGPFGSVDLLSLAWLLLVLGTLGGWLKAGRPLPTLRPWGVFLPLLVLVGLLLVGAPSALEPGVALAQARGVGLALMLYLLVRNDRSLRTATLGLLPVVLLIQSGVAIGQFVSQQSLGLAALGEYAVGNLALSGPPVLQDEAGRRWLRAFALTPHPNILGGYLAAWLFVALVAAPPWPDARFGRPAQAVAGLLGGAALALTFSRGAWVGFGVALCGCWLAAWHQGWSDTARRGLAQLSLLSLLAAMLALLPNHELLVGRFNPSTSPLEGRSLAERAVEWRLAPRLVADRPWTGVGGGNYTLAAIAWHPDLLVDSPVQPAHNAVLLVTAETGLFGGLAWLVLIAQPLRSLFARRAYRPTVALAAALTALFVASFLDHYLWDRFAALVLMAVLLGSWASAAGDDEATSGREAVAPDPRAS